MQHASSEQCARKATMPKAAGGHASHVCMYTAVYIYIHVRRAFLHYSCCNVCLFFHGHSRMFAPVFPLLHVVNIHRHCPFGHLEVSPEWRPAGSVPQVRNSNKKNEPIGTIKYACKELSAAPAPVSTLEPHAQGWKHRRICNEHIYTVYVMPGSFEVARAWKNRRTYVWWINFYPVSSFSQHPHRAKA